MPVVFRCKRSGNTVSFSNEDDIRGMRGHEGYEEVKPVTEPANPVVQPKIDVAKRGRPKKTG